MPIKIGYCASPAEKQTGWLAFEPTYHPVREQISSEGPLRRCPASIEYSASAFNVSVPYDFVFSVERGPHGTSQVNVDYEKTTVNEKIAQHLIDLTDAENGTIQINVHPFWIFISDEPNVLMTVLSAHNQINPHPIRGQFNIYNWFRPVSYAINFQYGETISIHRNSPIYQVKFYHPKETRFTLHECLVTPEIFEHQTGQFMRGLTKHVNWNRVFNYSSMRRPRHVLKFKK